MKKTNFLKFLFIFLIANIIIHKWNLLTSMSNYLVDLTLQFYPWLNYLREEIVMGNFPMWNPFSFLGISFVGNIQSFIFYPLTIIYTIFPFPVAYKISLYLHYFITSYFFYLLLSQLKKKNKIVPSIFWITTAYFLFRVRFLGELQASSFLPIVILFLLRNKKNFFIISFSLVILAGHPQIVYYNLIIYAFIYFTLIIFRKIKLRDVKILLYTPISFVLASIQFLPFLEAYKKTPREFYSYNIMADWSLSIRGILSLFYPFAPWKGDNFVGWGQYWTDCIHVGLIPVLSVIILLFLKNKKNKIIYFLLFLSLIFAIGKTTPFYFFLYKNIPFLNKLRHPATFSFFSTFLILLLFSDFLKYIKKNFIPFIFLFQILNIIYFYSSFDSNVETSFYYNKHKLFISKTLKNSYKKFRFYLKKNIDDITLINPHDLVKIRDLQRQNFNILSRIAIFAGYDPLQNSETINMKLAIKRFPPAKYILGISNVKYILSTKKLKDFKLVKKLSYGYIYENDKFLEKFRVLKKIRYIKTKPSERENIILKGIAKGKFNVKKEAIIEDNLNLYITYNSKVKLKKLFEDVNGFKIYAETNMPSLLFCSIPYYPGWNYYLNKKRIIPLKIDYMFTGIKLKKGENIIIGKFLPVTFYLGFVLTSLAIIFYILKYALLNSNTCF